MTSARRRHQHRNVLEKSSIVLGKSSVVKLVLEKSRLCSRRACGVRHYCACCTVSSYRSVLLGIACPHPLACVNSLLCAKCVLLLGVRAA